MGVGGRKFVGARAKVRCGACGHMGVGARKYAQTCIKVRCGGRGRMGVEGRQVRRREGEGAGMCGERCAPVGA